LWAEGERKGGKWGGEKGGAGEGKDDKEDKIVVGTETGRFAYKVQKAGDAKNIVSNISRADAHITFCFNDENLLFM